MDFMIVCSDVIYTAGYADDYDAEFYEPYEGYPRPIYALPGNHDWYDGLVGFMHHLCGADMSSLPIGRPPLPWESACDGSGAVPRSGVRASCPSAGAARKGAGRASVRPTSPWMWGPCSSSA